MIAANLPLFIVVCSAAVALLAAAAAVALLALQQVYGLHARINGWSGASGVSFCIPGRSIKQTSETDGFVSFVTLSCSKTQALLIAWTMLCLAFAIMASTAVM
eukprot:GHRR01006667.1.p2 GENE.GHRR01006667.1~~GHRR01006667.1.p2  ORF type:complete len:119 (-),score=32.53 GHRR01006667.1:1690-1998(-)